MARNKILLKGSPIKDESFAAGEAITPGHLINLNSSGQWVKNTANADDVAPTFALEREEMGKEIEDAYASGDVVKAATMFGGCRVYAWLASGQNAAIGDYLTGNNAGLMTKTGVVDGVRLARAIEAVDATAADPTTGARIRIEIC